MNCNDIRYRKLGYVALGVTNLDVARDFYTRIVGLTLTEATPDALYMRCSGDHHNVVLYAAAEPGLQRIGWEMESATALEALEARLSELGHKVTPLTPQEEQSLHISRAFRVHEPVTGATLEFYAAMENALDGFMPTHTKIMRLGHVILGSKDKPASEAFFTAINFRYSDTIGDAVSFMRCFPNPFHHSFGVARAEKNHFHHLNFMVQDMEDIGRANNRMKEAGVPIVFGPGHHPASESVFFYFLDPDSMTLEYSFGMEEFPESNPREYRKLPPDPASLDRWGGKPAAEFAKTGSIS